MSPYQRGFVNGRYMLQNILDVDFHGLRITLNRSKGAIVLFDFAAAFPSMDHLFMWDVLHTIGIHKGAIGAIQKFYRNNRHWLRLNGGTFPSIDVASGVRQGCPLSPIVFAICADVLLRKLAASLQVDAGTSDNMVCAFADDTAVVLENMANDLPKLHHLFTQYAAISGLLLNAKKTVLIPLWGDSHIALEDAQIVLLEVCPMWKDFLVTGSGKYLGFWIGPLRQDKSWDDPLKKFRTRTDLWAGYKLGIPCNATAYRSYCFSVLGFIWQLDSLPIRALEDELWALRRLAAGPGNWWRRIDLFLLRESYGMPFAFPCMEIVALAAKLRVCYTLALDVEARLARLQEVEFFLPPTFAASWHANNFHQSLARAQLEIRNKYGISWRSEIDKLSLTCPTTVHNKRSWIGKRLQRHLCVAMVKALAAAHPVEHHLGNKLSRWQLTEPPGILTRRALRRLHTIGRHCSPCVAAQYWRMLWNGWCTGRRFQRRGGRCVFGCDAGDSLEHYCRCQWIWKFLTTSQPNGPGVHLQWKSVETFFLLHKALPDQIIPAMATALHAIFKARHAHCRGHPPFSDPIQTLRSFYHASNKVVSRKPGCEKGRMRLTDQDQVMSRKIIQVCPTLPEQHLGHNELAGPELSRMDSVHGAVLGVPYGSDVLSMFDRPTDGDPVEGSEVSSANAPAIVIYIE